MPESGWKSTHEDSEDLNEVKIYFEWMIDYFPDEGKYYAELANTLRQMGQYKKALEYIEQALKMDPLIWSSLCM